MLGYILCGTCCGLMIVVCLILLFSISQLSATSMGLKYNWVLQKVDPIPETTSGLKVIPFSILLQYPKTIQTIDYDQSNRDLLDGRTSDGLPLILGVAFQYRLDPAGLFDLYHTFGDDYKRVFHKVGAHLVTEYATNFTAYQFFNEKQNIAIKMQQGLNDYFQKHLYAFVESFQINEDDLPQAFYDSVLEAATTKQNITRTEKLYDWPRSGLVKGIINIQED